MSTQVEHVRSMLDDFQQRGREVRWVELPDEVGELRKRDLSALTRGAEQICTKLMDIVDAVAEAVNEHWDADLAQQLNEVTGFLQQATEYLDGAADELTPAPTPAGPSA